VHLHPLVLTLKFKGIGRYKRGLFKAIVFIKEEKNRWKEIESKKRIKEKKQRK
jgi:hypothetical protein